MICKACCETLESVSLKFWGAICAEFFDDDAKAYKTKRIRMKDARKGDRRPKKQGASHVHTCFCCVLVCIYWIMTSHVAAMFPT